MSAYVVLDIEVLDNESYEAYKQLAPATISNYGGRYIVRGGKVETLEGPWLPKRIVILEFPSLEKANAWYNSAEYTGLKAVRQSCTRSRMIFVEGV